MIKQIFIYWDTGFKNAPDIVKACLVSWKRFHYEGWSIHVLDNKNMNTYVDMSDFKDISICKAHFADILRLRLLKKYGGVWVDSTTFCVCPLESWLPEYIEHGIFMFEKPAADRLISNWFIYSEPGHNITAKWLGVAEMFWFTKKYNNDYYIHHHLFGDLFRTDSEFRNSWNHTKKIHSHNCLLMRKIDVLKKMTLREKQIIDQKNAYVYKLSHHTLRKFDSNSVLAYLLQHKITRIAGENYSVFSLLPSSFIFVHIGKCGGTYLMKMFADNFIFIQEAHVVKPRSSTNTKYIIWIRNPFTRFVSAFNYIMSLIHTRVSPHVKNTLQNSLAPGLLTNKQKNGYVISPRYDHLIQKFQTPTKLAESMTDPFLKKDAYELMTSDREHIWKGIGWYLDNGDFIEKHHHDILFVGRIEHMEEDCHTLSMRLNYHLDIPSVKIRENIDIDRDTYLSEKAKENLGRFFSEYGFQSIEKIARL